MSVSSVHAVAHHVPLTGGIRINTSDQQCSCRLTGQFSSSKILLQNYVFVIIYFWSLTSGSDHWFKCKLSFWYWFISLFWVVCPSLQNGKITTNCYAHIHYKTRGWQINNLLLSRVHWECTWEATPSSGNIAWSKYSFSFYHLSIMVNEGMFFYWQKCSCYSLKGSYDLKKSVI